MGAADDDVRTLTRDVVAPGIGVIGIYGVTAHAVSDRYREFGIRRALGAGTGSRSPGNLMRCKASGARRRARFV